MHKAVVHIDILLRTLGQLCNAIPGQHVLHLDGLKIIPRWSSREIVENWTLRSTGSFRASGNESSTSFEPDNCIGSKQVVMILRCYGRSNIEHTSLRLASKKV